MVNDIEVIDSHVHTFASDDVAERIITSFNKIYDIEFANPGNGTISNVLSNMKEGGIDKTVMVNFAPPKIVHQNNLWTLKAGEDSGGKLIPLVSFHPEMEGVLTEHLENYINAGARGIKLHPMAQGFDVRDRRMDELFRTCSQRRFPVLIHCGRVSNARLNEYSDFECIVPVIEKYPELPVILAHMADGHIDRCLEVSKRYSNVFLDTSIVITGYPDIMNVNEPSWLDDGQVVSIINQVGADRIIFGSDFPWGSPIHDLNRIMNFKLDHNQKELIFSGNAKRLFKL